MEFTRRYWATVALVALLAVWATVLERPLLVVGAGGVTAWLLVYQYRFVRTTGTALAALDIVLQTARTRVTAEERTAGFLAVRTDVSTELTIQVSADAPVGARSSGATVVLTPGTHESEQVFEVAWPVAGQFSFDQPTVTVTDPLGLFAETTQLGTAPTVTVEPRAQSDLHVGEGGTQLLGGFGEHETDATGSGHTPAEVRKYLPGDSVRQIDWKATARLAEPHVREFEGETDLETVLVVDHRHSMAMGTAGERKLDFARQVALALLENAQRKDDPLASTFVGDEGITERFDLGTARDHYRAIDTHLRTLEPTASVDSGAGAPMVDPARARVTAASLDGDTPFDRKLRPFFEQTTNYVERIATQPLFTTVRSVVNRRSGTVRTIIVTDDEHRTELREAVKLAQHGGGHVVVFLAPSVLYEDGGFGIVESAYDRYTAFEEFRRELASLPRVSAFEVGPADRLSSVLEAGRSQRRVRQ
ncbi:DUF58 domain-containing protein [Haloarcula laminariae]|uniref:DUF58 domain-containing protein n=1 Tax=Haloarcula laminariae TaxID=2961577 RepID=UPI0024072904|nr:DUF58 domain-containing protein [Halomicroarcula sp. FL173]